MTGFADGPPMRAGGALADFVGGLYLGLGVVAALLRAGPQPDVPGGCSTSRTRTRSSPSPTRAASIYAAGIGVVTSAAREPAPLHRALRRAAGQGRLTWRWPRRATSCSVALCEAIGRPELGRDERYRSHRVRAANRREINASVADWVASGPARGARARWDRTGADVPVARVAAPGRAAGRPAAPGPRHDRAPPHPTLGRGGLPRQPAPLRRCRAPPPRAGARLGEHNAEVYAELGLDAGALAALAEKGVI